MSLRCLPSSRFSIGVALWLSVMASLSGYAQVETARAQSGCMPVPTPVISLGFGSRYTADSATRSDIDEESNKAVDEALQPIDKFIQDLSRAATVANTDANKRVEAANCVQAAILKWASADALSDMQSMNANLAVPSRIAGMAVAYAQVSKFLTASPADKSIIDEWLRRRARDTVRFFNAGVPKNASRNNLRAWASFAVGEVGIIVKDKALVTWAQNSNKAMIAQSSTDGSLPLEMARGKYALHYQLHALSPLVTSMARLCENGYGNAGANMARLKKIAQFSVAAIKDKSLVESLANAVQVLEDDRKKLSGMLAWLEPYKAITGDSMPDAGELVTRPLLNSKLGGDLTRLYGSKQLSCAR